VNITSIISLIPMLFRDRLYMSRNGGAGGGGGGGGRGAPPEGDKKIFGACLKKSFVWALVALFGVFL